MEAVNQSQLIPALRAMGAKHIRDYLGCALSSAYKIMSGRVPHCRVGAVCEMIAEYRGLSHEDEVKMMTEALRQVCLNVTDVDLPMIDEAFDGGW